MLAGLGVGAAIHYYRELALAAEQNQRTLDMVMVHAQTSQVFAYVEAGDREGLAAYLSGFIARSQAAGAEFAIIPAVTPHYCLQPLTAISPLPVLNIVDPLLREVTARQIRRISVFGAMPVMKSALYGLAGDVEIVTAQPEELETIHKTYLSLLQTQTGTAEQHRTLTSIAHAIVKREEVDAIVLAGTDLSLIFNPANIDFPYLDCAALHLQAIEEAMLNSTPPA
ncbi:Aspartate racemase [Acidisarcina polymorpha]|uniref:Aspartate racemase n=1 Tax=Acidisarcina polymorpha TaxID=2211140 RepID=A0A2Z5G5X1_9BACT|nr:aspartate/glutamate racemase family protein [Acidisarcina polymorpha]AXC14491.1 Aspartate racemase [Acidisarcina polymorpha]